MKTAIIFDCEFLVSEGAPSRFWCGPYDPDPIIVQIGAAKLALENPFEIVETKSWLVKPIDRYGAPYPIDPLFTRLCGIDDADVASDGVALRQALTELSEFSQGARLWSWGKDEFNMIAISCYVAGIPAALPAAQCDNACKLLLAAGMRYEDIKKTRSNHLADYYKIDHPPLRAHDALDDALSVAYVLQHLLRNGDLNVTAFETRKTLTPPD